jgi:hypothetical protein
MRAFFGWLGLAIGVAMVSAGFWLTRRGGSRDQRGDFVCVGLYFACIAGQQLVASEGADELLVVLAFVLGGVLIGRIWQRGGIAWNPSAPAYSARPDESPRP